MNYFRFGLLMALCAATTTDGLYAQRQSRGRKRPRPSLVAQGDKDLSGTQSPAKRPSHVNNAETPYFPPVINQVGGSCGSASRIYYMFGYETNCYRRADASRPENQYPTHFTWLYTNSNSSKDGMARANGVPNSVVYGGQLYSKYFGIQDCADTDFGWMQGYDNWYSAMSNRLERNPNFPQSVESEEGREAVKQWLWNHGGNPLYPGGGICGIGVASACTQDSIPNTPANTDAGVVGKKYVKVWGKQVDHALTIVGYDDRIEFDLDGNGIAGEKDKDEVGAWIVVNSWGNQWANQGFIYCPYKNAVTTADSKDYYRPEVYYVRRDYRPLRTMRIKMDYSRRSELRLSAGISEDLDATEPSQTTLFEAFKFAGDGNGDGKDAETPMLGRWTDGMHYEPMEFGYDLTDLSAKFNTRKPLKYFFIIETKDGARGKGQVYDCSVIDYEFDTLGIETLHQTEGRNVRIENRGRKTVISFIVAGEPFNAPRNLVRNQTTLAWERPEASYYTLKGFNVYRNDSLLSQLKPDVCSYKAPEALGNYQVCAAYGYNDSTVLSPRIGVINETYYGQKPGKENHVRSFTNSGFVINDIFKESFQQATIEYWLRPDSVYDYNQIVGPGWDEGFMIHTTDDGRLAAGEGWGARIDTRKDVLVPEKWTHVALTFNKGTYTLYVNGEKAGEATSGKKLFGGFGNLSVGTDSIDGINGRVDEFRVWNTARTQSEIQTMMYAEVANPASVTGLLCEIKMDGETALADAAGHYAVELLDGKQQRLADNSVFNDARGLVIGFSMPNRIVAQTAITPLGKMSPNVKHSVWTVDGKKYETSSAPTILFKKPGTHTITLKAVSASGDEAVMKKRVTVEPQVKPEASFVAEQSVVVGQRISFINTTKHSEGCSYQWNLPGSTHEAATTTNVAASYEKPGTYTITLKATNAEGTSTHTAQLAVVNQQPQPVIDVTPDVILKGDTVTLQGKNTGTSSTCDWVVANANHARTFSGETVHAKLDEPGVYTVTLNASNELGSKSVVKQRAVTVCNADGETGLNFRGTGETVTFASPVDLKVNSAFAIEWWMYAQPSQGDAQHIGGSASNFLISTNAEGALVVTINGKPYKTDKNFITPSEWHHYAVSCEKGKVRVFKDGKRMKTFHTPKDSLPTLPAKMSIGGKDAPVNAIVDEFRIWNKAFDETMIRNYSNAPIADVKAAMKNDKLALYFNFNQSSGHVIDLTSTSRIGTRLGFGPDGDAWTPSLGVFSLSVEKR